MEVCTGCGAVAQAHPMVGVCRDAESGRMASFPVCERCWRDPTHRMAPLKMHFFPRFLAEVAVAAAGSSSIGG